MLFKGPVQESHSKFLEPKGAELSGEPTDAGKRSWQITRFKN
jgi:hypothetical protein